MSDHAQRLAVIRGSVKDHYRGAGTTLSVETWASAAEFLLERLREAEEENATLQATLAQIVKVGTANEHEELVMHELLPLLLKAKGPK